MSRRMQSNRVIVELTPEQEERLRQAQEDEEQCREQTIETGHRLKSAAEEQTVSGALRRAVHAHAGPGVTVLARKTGIPREALNAFLEASGTLSSEQIDRLAAEIDCQLVQRL